MHFKHNVLKLFWVVSLLQLLWCKVILPIVYSWLFPKSDWMRPHHLATAIPCCCRFMWPLRLNLLERCRHYACCRNLLADSDSSRGSVLCFSFLSLGLQEYPLVYPGICNSFVPRNFLWVIYTNISILDWLVITFGHGSQEVRNLIKP